MKAIYLILGLVLSLVVALLAFGLPLGESLRLIFDGSVGDRAGWSRTLVKATPLVLTGLGMVIAWRAGMYNVGGEGQLIVGALAGATVAALLPQIPGPLMNVAILVSGTVGGGLYAALAGWLQVARGVQAVISTILLNFIAIQLLGWAVNGPLKRPEGGLPLSSPLPESAMLLRFDRQLDVHSGVVYAVCIALLCWVFLYKTSWGFRLRLVGASASAARANRIPANRIAVTSMALSGALCGMAGCVEYTGITGTLGAGFPQGWGFLGIPVALLGGLHPIGVLGSGLYFGALFAGSESLGRFTSGGSTVVYVIQAVAVLAFVAFTSLKPPRSKVPVGGVDG